MKNIKDKKLRRQEWFVGNDKMDFVHRSWLCNQGYPDDNFSGKPVIDMCNTWSESASYNGHLRDFDDLGSKISLLVNLMPSGKHLMEDLFYAGGLSVVMEELEGLLHNNDIISVKRKAPEPLATRGYVKIYSDHVEQAEKGADPDVLVGKSGSKVDLDLH